MEHDISPREIAKLRVLVVDDDPSVLDFISCLLSGMGLRDIHTALSADEALTRIKESPQDLDVVLCDLDMPNIDGIEFLRHLADSAYRGAVGIISGADARVITAVERLAKTHNLFFLGYLEKHHLDVSLLSTLLARAKHGQSPLAPVLRAGFQEWEIRQAISSGELEVYYQPKVDTKTGVIKGAEALLRWNHPEHGLMPPPQLIAAAERYKLIDEVSYVVAEQAIGSLGRWHSMGHKINLSINLSSQSLYGLDLPEKLMEHLERAQLEPRYLTLEITESQVLEELSAPMEILTRLCLKGLGLSIDDFGTGYASLEQLNRLPFSELKIDQCFVQQAPTDEASRIILESSVSMAKRLGMRVVAEGVEDKVMWDLICDLGCDEVQGFYIAKAMPQALFEEWMQERIKEHAEV